MLHPINLGGVLLLCARLRLTRLAHATLVVQQVCPTAGEEVDGRVVDVDCNTDKLEVCLTTTLGCDALGGGCGEDTQASIVQFLSCFEATHHANTTFAASCAEAATVDWEKVMACYHDKTKREKLWQQHLDSPARAGLEHFPTVLVDGAPWSIYNDTVRARLLPRLPHRRKTKLHRLPDTACAILLR